MAPLAPVLEVELIAVLTAVMDFSKPSLLAIRAFKVIVSFSTSVRLVVVVLSSSARGNVNCGIGSFN